MRNTNWRKQVVKVASMNGLLIFLAVLTALGAFLATKQAASVQKHTPNTSASDGEQQYSPYIFTPALRRMMDVAAIFFLSYAFIICPILAFRHPDNFTAAGHMAPLMQLLVADLVPAAYGGVWLILRHLESKGRIDLREQRLRRLLLIMLIVSIFIQYFLLANI
jgi:hypothetical protein